MDFAQADVDGRDDSIAKKLAAFMTLFEGVDASQDSLFENADDDDAANTDIEELKSLLTLPFDGRARENPDPRYLN
ncbi:hypothetical protein [Noviherbaspirillum cavernae]|uniref:hypothetical protein n=1 Tax=Noviherbaspirillum cavernae TaxID=2320862 RepID=UPI0011C46AE5|nr:hypothetical protein [Noviherbaspirillum cavernae]